MKANSLLFVLICSVVLISCKKDDDKTFLLLGKSKLEFGYNDNLTTLTVSNISEKTLQWSVSSPDDYFNFSEDGGTLDAGQYLKIEIGLKREIITDDSARATLRFTSSIGKDVSMNVLIKNYPEKKIRVPYNITDVAFDADKQLLYLLPANDPFIDIYDLTKKSFFRLNLSISDYYYYNLSGLKLMPGGERIVISGYDRMFVIDRFSGDVLHSHQFTNQSIISFACAPDEKIFFTTTGWSALLYSFDLKSGQVTSHDVSISNHYIDIHPTLKYLYGINYGLNKIDISGTAPELVYSHSQSSIGDRLWIASSGQAIATSSGVVFTIDPELQGNDITNTNNIPMEGMSSINDIAFNMSNGEYYVVFRSSEYYNPTYRLDVFNNDLAPSHTITPEPFLSVGSGNNYQSDPAMALKIFMNEKEGTIILVTRPATSDYYSINAIEILPFE
jgi:hypothetical protein